MVVEKEYLLATRESVTLSDYQNQRVEVTGTLSAIPDAAPAQPARGEAQTSPATSRLSILKVASVKVVSTECK
jgi:hypothetical protein